MFAFRVFHWAVILRVTEPPWGGGEEVLTDWLIPLTGAGQPASQPRYRVPSHPGTTTTTTTTTRLTMITTWLTTTGPGPHRCLPGGLTSITSRQSRPGQTWGEEFYCFCLVLTWPGPALTELCTANTGVDVSVWYFTPPSLHQYYSQLKF